VKDIAEELTMLCDRMDTYGHIGTRGSGPSCFGLSSDSSSRASPPHCTSPKKGGPLVAPNRLEFSRSLERRSSNTSASPGDDGTSSVLRQSIEPLGPKIAEMLMQKLPYGGESVLLMTERWTKLASELYSKKKGGFDISKVPDIYDSAKYDALHNSHMDLRALPDLLKVAKTLASGVIPNEYGCTQKINIGKNICLSLLDKILADMQHAREESKATWSWEKSIISKKKTDCCTPSLPTSPPSEPSIDGDAQATVSAKGEASESDADDEDEHDTVHRLAPEAMDVRSPYRHVRTRLYFTSESHIHSLVTVLRYAHLLSPPGVVQPLLSDEAEEYLDTVERDYLTHVVIQMYEDMDKPIDDEARFRVEILFSPGSNEEKEETPNGAAEPQRAPADKEEKAALPRTLQDLVTCHNVDNEGLSPTLETFNQYVAQCGAVPRCP